MNNKSIISLGWITAIIFILGTFVLGSFLENYNPIAQTVSEIGEKGSPLYSQWQIFSIGVGCLLILFSFGTIKFSKQNGLSATPGVFILLYGLSQFFTGFFPFLLLFNVLFFWWCDKGCVTIAREYFR